MSVDARPVARAPGGAGPPAGAASQGWPRETLWLVRARWQIAYNSLVRGARWRLATYFVVALALLFLGLVALLVSWVLTRGIMNLTAPDVEAADVMVAMVMSATMTLSVLVSFTVALAALYLSADLDLLMSAPVARRAVFTSKLVGGLLPAHVLVLIMAFVPLVGHGMAQSYGGAYYAAVVAALLILPLLPMAVGSAAVMVIVRFVSAHRLGDIVALVVGAMTLSIAFVAGGARQLQQALTLADLLDVFNRVRSPYSPAEWLTRGMAAVGRQDLAEAAQWFGLTIAITVIVLVPLIIYSERLYFSGWMRLQSGDSRREMSGSRLPWNKVDNATSLSRPSGLFAWLSPPAVAVLRKDFRVIPRDLTNLAQVLSPLAIGVFFVLQRLLYPVRIGDLERPPTFIDPLVAMLSAGVAAAVAAMIMSRFCLTAFSIEGKSYWLIKSAPISRREVVVSKYLVAYVPYLALGGVLVLMLEVARAVSDARAAGALTPGAVAGELDLGLMFYAWFVVAVVGAGVLAINLAIGAARPNMRWDTPHEMLTPDVGCLSIVLYGAYGFIAVLALLVPAATSGFRVVSLAGPMWVLGLGLGLGLTAAVVASAYALSVREVDGIAD